MKTLISVFLCILVTSCSLRGTDTGNPGFNSGIQDEISQNVVERLTIRICDLVTECEEVPDCTTRVLEQQNIDTEIGVPEGDYDTLSDISNALRTGALFADSITTPVCLANVEDLTCSSPGVDKAYDATKSNAFEGVAAIIPDSCNGLISSSLATED